MNSGVEPNLLPPEQCAWATNASFRGGYVQHRPRFQRVTLNFNDDAALQAAVEEGFFQGAGVYRPDFGLSQVIAQIGGRLFSFTVVNDVATVAEITIPGDANDATTNQVWMWQAEKWLIITDGTVKLPIFYDGVSCRRSYGPSEILVPAGGINATLPVKPPGIGNQVTLTLANPYTGPYDTTVIFNGAFYQTVGSYALGNILLTNLTGTPAAVVPTGTDIVVNPNLVGYTQGNAISSSAVAGAITCVLPLFCNTPYNIVFTLSLTSVGSLAVGSSVTITTSNGPFAFTVTSILGNTITVARPVVVHVAPCGSCVAGPAPATETIADNSLVQFSSSIGPNVILGQLTQDFTNPAVDGVDDAYMTVAYTGPANQLVQMGGSNYIINAAPTVGGVSLILINLTDTSTDDYDTVPDPLSGKDIRSVPELPAGRMGAYGMGRNWMSLTDGISFIAGDIVGGPAGTVAYSYRDSVLKTTENDYLAAGGTFRLPNSGEIINAMWFTANLDTSLGQGNLLVGTDSTIFSCNTPVDRTTWTALENPILTQSLVGFGPLAQNSTTVANSDTLFRSVDGLASLIIARRNFNEWGNTPISREMQRIFAGDELSLLSYGSSTVLDNRYLATVAPSASGQGVYHSGLVALNFDLISNLRGKAPPIYDGLWTGLNTLQIVSGKFSGVVRTFVFGYHETEQTIELYQIMRDEIGGEDNGETRIQWNFETPCIFKPESRDPQELLVRLTNGQIHVRDVVGVVNVTVKYRPDFYPCWIDWKTFEICADTTVTDGQPGYRTPIGFGEPAAGACESANNRQYRVGRFFQVRIEITGSCKVMGMDFEAVYDPSNPFVPPLCCDVDTDTIPLPT